MNRIEREEMQKVNRAAFDLIKMLGVPTGMETNKWYDITIPCMYDDDGNIRIFHPMMIPTKVLVPDNGWISVKDRLPDFNVEVLVTNGNEIYLGCVNDYSLVDDEDPYPWSCHFGRLRDATHWMPLPEGPG